MTITKQKLSLSKFFEAIEESMPSIKDEPGYFKHNPHAALKLAGWIRRYQRMCDAHIHEFGNLTFTVFDLETTGLESAKFFETGLAGVTDVAGLKIVNFEYKGNAIDENGIQDESENEFEYQSLSNPGVVIPDAVVNVTNITNEMVSTAPKQREAIDKFNRFSKNTILVGHNIGDSQYNKRGFDIPRVLGPISKTYYNLAPMNILENAIDTLPMFQNMIKGVRHTNSELGERLGFKLVGAHRAMPDVRVNAIAFAKLAKIFYECPVDKLVAFANVKKNKENFNIYYMNGSKIIEGNNEREWINIAVKLITNNKELNKDVVQIKYYPNADRFIYPTHTQGGRELSDEILKSVTNRQALMRQVSVFNRVKNFTDGISKYRDIEF